MVRDKSFYKTILRLSLPSAIQSAANLLVVMADNVMVTRTGENALSAVSQSNAVTNFVNAGLTGLATGAVVLISQYWGKRDLKRIRTVCAVSLAACLTFALLALMAVELFPRALLGVVINRGEKAVTDLAMQYLPIVALSYIPLALTASMIGMLKGVEVVRVTLYTTLMSLAANIGLNYVLIFGHLGLPALGVRGAAIATVITRILEAAVVCFYMFRVQKRLPIKPRHLLESRGWAWQDYTRYGLPVGLTDAQWALVGLLKAVILGQMGKAMIDAAAVTDMMMNLGTMFTFALAGGACVMVGKAVGERDYRRVREYSGTIQILFACIGVVMCALVFLLRKPFAGLYALETPTYDLATRMIAICSLTLLGTTYHASCFVGINRGAGDSRFVMIVDMICGWLIVLPLSALAAFVFHWPNAAVYFCTRIDQCFKWIIAFFRLRGNKWIRNVTRSDDDREVGADEA
ncbi:MAG: MATE family efflux transporter [Clostridia bacterium]|nr:MATE family efflux transporter [Clostridia bacterium]